MDYARPFGQWELDAMYGEEFETANLQRAYDLTNFLRATNVRHVSIDQNYHALYEKWVNFLLPNTIKFVTIKF